MADEALDFYHRELETLDRRSLRDLQSDRLARLMQELEGNRFYKKKFQLAGLEMHSIRSAEDLKRVPFTTKSELFAEQQAHPPYGTLLTYPIERYRYLHQTSGTTFRPIKWLDTGEVDFRIHSYSRLTRTANLFTRVGMRAVGQFQRHRYLARACKRMAALVSNYRSEEVVIRGTGSAPELG